MRAPNQIGRDGKSVTPDGVYDMADGADNVQLDEAVAAKLSAAMKDLSDSDIQAKFKLEIALSSERSIHKPTAGVICAWTNGGFNHGGGDQVVYLCPQRVDLPGGGNRSCATPLSIMMVSKRIAVCPGCKRVTAPEDLVGQVVARLTVPGWVRLIERMFYHLECNADIRLGILRENLIKAHEREMEKDRGGDEYRKAREAREWIAYPLKNIIKDTAAGAQLSTRIRAFLYA